MYVTYQVEAQAWPKFVKRRGNLLINDQQAQKGKLQIWGEKDDQTEDIHDGPPHGIIDLQTNGTIGICLSGNGRHEFPMVKASIAGFRFHLDNVFKIKVPPIIGVHIIEFEIYSLLIVEDPYEEPFITAKITCTVHSL